MHKIFDKIIYFFKETSFQRYQDYIMSFNISLMMMENVESNLTIHRVSDNDVFVDDIVSIEDMLPFYIFSVIVTTK